MILPALKSRTFEVEALWKELPSVKLTWTEPNETYLKPLFREKGALTK